MSTWTKILGAAAVIGVGIIIYKQVQKSKAETSKTKKITTDKTMKAGIQNLKPNFKNK